MTGKNHLTTNICTIVAASVGLSKLSANTNIVPLVDNFRDGYLWSDLAATITDLFIPLGFVHWWPFLYLSLFLLGTLLPDSDSRESMLGRYFYMPVKHRTWTHTVYLLAPLIALYYVHHAFAWFALGYFLHLFWDSLSACGVAWFRPMSGYRVYAGGAKVKKGHWLKLYTAGAVSEHIFVAIILALTLYLVAAKWLLPML